MYKGDSLEAQQEFAKSLAQTMSSLEENSEDLQVKYDVNLTSKKSLEANSEDL